jgi:hypothetical protein
MEKKNQGFSETITCFVFYVRKFCSVRLQKKKAEGVKEMKRVFAVV